MAKISLLQKLSLLQFIKLAFVGQTPSKDKDGNAIATLELAVPIPRVVGSQEVEYNGARYPVTAQDVKFVKVHKADMEDAGFSFDDQTDLGSYEGSSLQLDVAKRGLQVWLRSKTFAQSGTEFGNVQRNENIGKMLGLVANEAPKPGIVNKEVVEPVDAGGKKK